jgi:hypothetical protein
VKNLGSRRNGIRCGFRRLFFCFTIILASTLAAASSTGTLTVSPSTINFGSVPVGSSQTQSVTLANPGGPKVTITQATVSGTGFTLSGLSYPLTLAGGQSATCIVTFAPQSGGSDSGSVSIAFSAQTSNGKGNNSPSYNSSTTLTVPLSGTAVMSGQLVPNPSTLTFGNVQVGSSQSQWETITNASGSSITISQITDAGTGFTVSGLSLPTTLTPNQSLTFSTTFAPQTASSATGTITVSSNASNPTLTIPQTGTGTTQGQLAVSPTSANFGNVTVGTSTSLAGTLSATGTSVTVSSASVNNPEFSLSGVSLPLTIAAGQSVPITVTFTPQASGTASGTLSFTSNASNVATESLAGDGVATLQHSVSLSWGASTSVVGYNVYRGGTSGGPYTKINSALDASTNYTDSSVQAGQTYYYVTTAVNSSGTESAYSNQVQAVIPSP